jgi:hypothetical protein
METKKKKKKKKSHNSTSQINVGLLSTFLSLARMIWQATYLNVMDLIIWAFTVFMLSYVLPLIYSIKLRCIVCTKTVISNCSQITHSESI